MVFTEMDHNYVNPISDAFIKRIKKAMKKRSTWTAGKYTSGYTNEYAVFNEYMTWAVFLLYAHDRYSDETLATVQSSVVRQMAQYRGFILFEAFSNELMHYYTPSSTPPSIESMFIPMLKWCERQ